MAFGYLSVLPLRPSFTSYPFDQLAHIPPLEKTKDGFRLIPALAARWQRLELRLAFAISLLKTKYNIGSILPFFPSAWGYIHPHKSHHIAHQRAVISRDWFSIFMAGLSFLIAAGKSRHPDNTIPGWFTTLAELGFDQTWLSGVASSPVCTFSPFIARVGVFVDLLDQDKDQPPVEWFCRYHIPVWYPWRAEEVRVITGKPSLTGFVPPPYKLQEATTFITQSPSAPSKSTKTYPTWKDFFAERDRLNARKLEKETPKERQTRLNRERKHPTISAQVFEWLESEDDPSQLVRTPVLRRAREETLENYGVHQKRYDAFWNEWDCCEQFGPADSEDGDDDDYWEPGQPGELIQPDLEYEPPTPSHQRSPSPPLIADENLPVDEDTYEVSDMLSMHYGFIPPLPTPNRPGCVYSKTLETLFRVIGLAPGKHPIFSTGLGPIIFDFVESITSNQRPGSSLWDLDQDNRQPLSLTDRVKHLRRLPSGLLFFDFGCSATVPWKIGVFRADDALHICRLDPNFDEIDIARKLLEQGVRFHTLLPLKIPCMPSPSSMLSTLPIRLPGYQFSKRDYNAYLHQRATILRGRGGRAALLRGGILWRLAMEEVSHNTALRGFSSALLDRDSFTVWDSQSGDYLWDDDLSENDIQLVCGTYTYYTGMFYY